MSSHYVLQEQRRLQAHPGRTKKVVMGRRRLDPRAARRWCGAVMFTDDEYDAVQIAAAASRRSLSAWLRELAALASASERPVRPAQRSLDAA